MNHVKRLEIFGFKSFSGRKELTIPLGLNCITGPNGSGKSNVSEAICFVLGKASRKELRAEKLGDLVYNGGKKLPPSKFAKVSIILDNKNRKFPVEEDELRISRKVDKDGKSLFRVNGQRQTREYVKSILTGANIDPDGYNVVMQGEIEKFIDLSSDERRKIIEDLSGISIYEEKKRKSLLEIDKVDEKIKEAEIILRQNLRHMEELKRDKEQAEKFGGLQQALRYKKAAKLKLEIDEIISEQTAVEKKMNSKQKEIDAEKAEDERLKTKIESHMLELEKTGRLSDEMGSTEQAELNKEIEELRLELGEQKTRESGAKNEIKRIDLRKIQIEKDVAENKNKEQKLNADAKGFETELEGLDAKKEKARAEKEKLAGLDNEKVDVVSEINTISGKINALQSELSLMHGSYTEHSKKEGLEKELEKKERLLKELLEKDSTYALEISEAQEKARRLEKELSKLEAKKELSFGLLKKGTRAVLQLKESGKIKGIHGIVQDLAKTDEKYAMPLKIAAGSRSDSIVVESVEIAKECIEYLRENNIGYATFLPLDKLKNEFFEKNAPKTEGVVDLAINLVKYSPKYDVVFKHVFSDTLIVENIETAKKIGITKTRMVTMHGDLIEKSGSMTGGKRDRETVGFKSEPMDEKIKEISGAHAKLLSEISDIESDRTSLNGRITTLRNETFHLNTSIESIGKFDISRYDELKKEVKSLESEKESKEAYLKTLPEKVDRETIEKANKKIEDIQEKINEVTIKKNGIGIQIGIIKSDMESSNGIIAGLIKEKEKFEKEIISAQESQKKLEEKISKKMEAEKKFHEKLRELNKKKQELSEKIKEFEIKRATNFSAIERLKDEFNNFKLEHAGVIARLEGKNAAKQEFADIKLEEIRERKDTLEKQIPELEERIKNFGAVNMRALDVYNEVEREYNALKQKADKLLEEKEEIIKVMQEVEEKKKETFFETFKFISKNFERVFTVLSPNGEAHMIVENEEDPFSGGIDIIAKPGGKKFVSLRAMSGGEKTLTTLAFIFAVQEYIPSPFYIMDEVEAALDRENSERLSYLLSEYSKTSQFIVVTHNDSVIAQADCVYGVSMNELGESQIISMKLPDK